jgi:uncharacterized membrane protein (GlpM family)
LDLISFGVVACHSVKERFKFKLNFECNFKLIYFWFLPATFKFKEMFNLKFKLVCTLYHGNLHLKLES